MEDIFKLNLPSMNCMEEKSILCESYFDPCYICNGCKNAHSFDEFNPLECIFGIYCNKKNNKFDACKYLHPNENKEELILRMYGLEKEIETLKENRKEEEEKIEKKDEKTEEKSEEKGEEKDEENREEKREEKGEVSELKKMIRFSKICKSILIEGECLHLNCNFAHSISQFKPLSCKFKENCQNYFECKFIHPNESKEECAKRLGLQDENEIDFQKVVSKKKEKYSRFCTNIINFGKCERKICTFAHSIRNLKPIPCKYIRCRRNDCYFIHLNENFEEYLKRNKIPQNK